MAREGGEGRSPTPLSLECARACRTLRRPRSPSAAMRGSARIRTRMRAPSRTRPPCIVDVRLSSKHEGFGVGPLRQSRACAHAHENDLVDTVVTGEKRLSHRMEGRVGSRGGVRSPVLAKSAPPPRPRQVCVVDAARHRCPRPPVFSQIHWVVPGYHPGGTWYCCFITTSPSRPPSPPLVFRPTNRQNVVSHATLSHNTHTQPFHAHRHSRPSQSR